MPKCKLEIVAQDMDVPAILEAIVSGASSIDTAVQVRTRDMGEVAV
ncbi:MAG: hypothetical protein AAB037_06675 [Chloroflexota bacterium]